jgi:type VI secretion system protein ImpK
MTVSLAILCCDNCVWCVLVHNHRRRMPAIMAATSSSFTNKFCSAPVTAQHTGTAIASRREILENNAWRSHADTGRGTVSRTPINKPGEADPTVIMRSLSGGRGTAPAPECHGPSVTHNVPVATVDPAGPELESLSIIDTPLLTAATPLLGLIGLIVTSARFPDPQVLRERAGREIAGFERRCRNAGVSMELLRPAHYALCVAIDHAVLHTPWGATSVWSTRSLTASFYRDSPNEKQFFEMLAQMLRKPGRFLPVIELMYLCLCLGFVGDHRAAGQDAGIPDRLRNEVCALILRRRNGPVERLLRQLADAAAACRNKLAALPVLRSLTAAAVVMGLVFAWISQDLKARSDAIHARIAALPPTGMPQIVRRAAARPVLPPQEAPGDRIVEQLKDPLADETVRQFVSVPTTNPIPVIRINSRTMFEPDGASVGPAFVPLLEGIGTILKEEPGSVEVVGHTDDMPVHSLQFASNTQLSLARAQAVRAVMLRTFLDAGRISAEGRGDADPIVSNATPESREQNRRIEILLRPRE